MVQDTQDDSSSWRGTRLSVVNEVRRPFQVVLSPYDRVVDVGERVDIDLGVKCGGWIDLTITHEAVHCTIPDPGPGQLKHSDSSPRPLVPPPERMFPPQPDPRRIAECLEGLDDASLLIILTCEVELALHATNGSWNLEEDATYVIKGSAVHPVQQWLLHVDEAALRTTGEIALEPY